MRRGELWTVASGSGYAGEPRPAVIIQDNAFSDGDSITVCLLTTDDTDAPLVRIPVEPNELTGLRQQSRIMIDKVMTVRRANLGTRIGRVDDGDLIRIGQALIVFLGLAGSSSQTT